MTDNEPESRPTMDDVMTTYNECKKQLEADASVRKLHLWLHIATVALVGVECLLMAAAVVMAWAHWF